jgi:hypothetical protein
MYRPDEGHSIPTSYVGYGAFKSLQESACHVQAVAFAVSFAFIIPLMNKVAMWISPNGRLVYQKLRQAYSSPRVACLGLYGPNICCLWCNPTPRVGHALRNIACFSLESLALRQAAYPKVIGDQVTAADFEGQDWAGDLLKLDEQLYRLK